MANNRLYIRCKCCKNKMYIGRHYEDNWYLPSNSNKSFEDIMNTFYDKHYECFFKEYDNQFEIITEYEIYCEEQGSI